MQCLSNTVHGTCTVLGLSFVLVHVHNTNNAPLQCKKMNCGAALVGGRGGGGGGNPDLDLL